MRRTAQVIDRFESRGKLVLTLWDLHKTRRFTIRVRREADIIVGELVDIRDEVPRLRRIYRDAVEDGWASAAILPMKFREPPADKTKSYSRGYGYSA